MFFDFVSTDPGETLLFEAIFLEGPPGWALGGLRTGALDASRLLWRPQGFRISKIKQ